MAYIVEADILIMLHDVKSVITLLWSYSWHLYEYACSFIDFV